MSEEKQEDERYDEAAVRRMGELWALMYVDLVKNGMARRHAVKVVIAWLKKTLASP